MKPFPGKSLSPRRKKGNGFGSQYSPSKNSKFNYDAYGDIESNNPYRILGVPRDATPFQIKYQWRRLALRYHPDKIGLHQNSSNLSNVGSGSNNSSVPFVSASTNETRSNQLLDKSDVQSKIKETSDIFAKISQAYEVLSDPYKRRRYDLIVNLGGNPNVIWSHLSTSNPGTSKRSSSNTRRDKSKVYPASVPPQKDSSNDNTRHDEYDDGAESEEEKDKAYVSPNVAMPVYSTSERQISTTADGKRVFITKTHQVIRGKKSIRIETLMSDGTRKVEINTNPDADKNVKNGLEKDGIRIHESYENNSIAGSSKEKNKSGKIGSKSEKSRTSESIFSPSSLGECALDTWDRLTCYSCPRD